jgi:hypothetical protein
MKRVFLIAVLLTNFLIFRNFAQILPDRTEVLLKLTPRPADHSVRDREVFFDQQAILRIKLRAASDMGTTNTEVQCVLLYDEVQTTGKIKRKSFTDIILCKLNPGEEKSFDSKELRLTGKITRDGQLIGMKFLGSGTRVYEDGKLIYELYQPQDLQKDAAALSPPLDSSSKLENIAAKKDATPTPLSTATSTLPVEKSTSAENQTDGVLDLFGYKFNMEEADKILKTVNNLTEEALISQIGLSKQAAHNLVLKRPFQKLEELPKVSYVKKQAIETLKLYVLKK